MTNAEAAVILAREIMAGDEWNEAIQKAVAALSFTDEVKIEVIEKHTFAKPDEVEDIDFPGTGRENK